MKITGSLIHILKTYWREITIVALLGVTIWLASRKDTIKTVTQIEYKDKIVKEVEEKVVYKDRVQVKTRTIVKKNGETRVEERTETGESNQSGSIRKTERQETSVKQSQSVEVRSETTRYLLGVGRTFDGDSYNIRVQYRPLPGLPLMVGPEVTTQSSFTKLSLGIGITVLF